MHATFWPTGLCKERFSPNSKRAEMTSKSSDKKNTWLKNELEMMHWDYQLWSDQLFCPHFFTKGKDMQNIHLYKFRPLVWSLELYVTQQLVSRKQKKCHFPIVFLVLKPSSPGRSTSQQFFEPAVPRLSHVLSLLVGRPQPALSILVIKSDQHADRQRFTSEQLAPQAALLGKMPLL